MYQTAVGRTQYIIKCTKKLFTVGYCKVLDFSNRRFSHNKPIGCGASGAFARGPDDDDEQGAHLTTVLSLKHGNTSSGET